MTVSWTRYAQSLTDKPVKGMLTGPVTLLGWSFPREDISRADIALQLSLALAEEVKDLQEAGINIIQIDEPAFREGLPLKHSQWQHYLDWATLKPVSAAVGPVVALGGWVALRRGWVATRFVMAWGTLMAATQYSIDLVKWVAGRERPVHWLPEGDTASPWLVSGQYSFPSGHTGYYWALALGIALRWPRFAVPALAVAIYVTEQRVLVLAHHGSDVLASIGIALLWAAALLPWLRERRASAASFPRPH